MMVSLGKLPFVHRAFSANLVLDHLEARSFAVDIYVQPCAVHYILMVPFAATIAEAI